MKSKIFKYSYWMLIIGVISAFYACKKSDVDNKELYAYISPNFQSTTNNFNIELRSSPVSKSIFGDSTIKISPIRLTRPFTKDVKVTLAVDTTLIKEYNAKMGTTYTALSQKDMIILSSSDILIKAGKMDADSISITVKNLKNLPDTTTTYVVPIKIATTDGQVQASQKLGTMFLLVNTKSIFSNINLNGDLSTATLIDRNNPAWTKVSTSGEDYGDVVDILDNSYSTGWLNSVSSTGLNAVIDTKSIHTIKGIQIAANYDGGRPTYNANKIEFLTSTDNVNWKSQGTYISTKWSGTDKAPDIRNIAFYNPVKAQYIKIVLTEAPNGYAGLSDFKLYQ